MKLTINGETTETSDGATISKLLEIRKVKMPDMVSVELNGDILRREDFDTVTVKDGDKVEFLYFMGGGSSK